MSRVIITHPKTGEAYSVEAADFRRHKHADGRTYEDKGFKITANEDGSPYEPPAPRAARSAKGAAEAMAEVKDAGEAVKEEAE